MLVRGAARLARATLGLSVIAGGGEIGLLFRFSMGCEDRRQRNHHHRPTAIPASNDRFQTPLSGGL
jgi:hypothetical protein